MLQSIKNNIPNCLTLMNLLSGTLAIIFSFHWDTLYCNQLLGWQIAAICIGAAAFFDFFDGAVARLLKAVSPIGKELDSLADLVSFGVAPALLLMNTLFIAGAGILSYTALFIPLMGAVRLAVFNIDTTQVTEFKGLPIPANAIFWIGFVAAMANGMTMSSTLAIILIAVFGLLMVSRLRMFSLKFKSLAVKGNVLRYFIIVATILLVALFGLSGLALTILLYIAMSVFTIIVKYQ